MSSCLPPACSSTSAGSRSCCSCGGQGRGGDKGQPPAPMAPEGSVPGSGLCSEPCSQGWWHPWYRIWELEWGGFTKHLCSPAAASICLPPSRLLDKENQDLAPSWMTAASPEGRTHDLYQPLSPSSQQCCVICSAQRGAAARIVLAGCQRSQYGSYRCLLDYP